jgi:hypothetical protein
MPGHDADRSTIVFDWKYRGVRVGPADLAIIYEEATGEMIRSHVKTMCLRQGNSNCISDVAIRVIDL